MTSLNARHAITTPSRGFDGVLKAWTGEGLTGTVTGTFWKSWGTAEHQRI